MSMEMFALQGLRQNTLVAGKTTALRMFMNGDFPDVAGIEVTILRPNGSRFVTSWLLSDLVIIPNSSQGPSMVVSVPGAQLPFIGAYYFRVRIFDSIGRVIATCTLDRVELQSTKDLRVMVSRIWSGTPTKPGELDAAHSAMERMAALFPIRDGISSLDGDRDAGLRYNLDDNTPGPPNQDNVAPLWDSFLNRPSHLDSIDAAILYRFPNPDEGPGANSRHPYKGMLPFCGIVWEAPLANVFCQETAHGFGLEPSDDPHLDPSGQGVHSKDLTIDALDAELGFDIQFKQSKTAPTFDIMFKEGPNPGRPDTTISLNSWDWEYLRTQLVKLPSTGPTGPLIGWQSLEGHDLQPIPALGKNADGRQEVFILGGDRKLYHRWETIPGGAWQDWSTLGGEDLQGRLVVASQADGRLQVFVCGGDRKIYFRTQVVPNGDWKDWEQLGGDQVVDFAVAQNADGRLEVLSVWGDGVLHDAWQIAPNGDWSGWANLGGHDLQGAVTVGQNADGRLEAYVVGGDGVVYHRWQLATNTGPWSDWSNLGHPLLPSVSGITVQNGPDGHLYLLMMRTDSSLSYRAQIIPNGEWDMPVDLGGHDLRWPAALGINPDGRLEVFVIGGDRQLYNRWQIDPALPNGWSDWAGLGGHDLQAGISLQTNSTDELEVYVIGGDGNLYRGLRG